jgi:aspartate beta-hydroxylase
VNIVGFDTVSTLSEADGAVCAGQFATAEALLTKITSYNANDFHIWLRLAVVRRRCGDHTGALEALTSALIIRPDDLSALLMKGSILSAFGRREEAARAYRQALDVAPPRQQLPPQISAEIDRAQTCIDADSLWRDKLAAIAFKMGDAASVAAMEKLRADVLTGRVEPLMLDGLPEVGFYDPADFAGVADFAAATPQILEEFKTLAAERAPELVIGHGIGQKVSDGAQSRKWSAIHLISDGELVEDNARFAPLSVELYERLGPPRIPGRSPNLMFSILDPHTRIPPHHGLINSRLVIHIPLIVPPHCGLRVGRETRAWQPGTAMIFDDTFEHEAWNDSDDVRIVLLGDLWRPELNAEQREAVTQLMARE